MLIAGISLIAGLVLSLRPRPDLLSGLAWRYAGILVLAAVPANLLLNGIELQLTARLVGSRLSFRDAMEVTVLSSAANTLPLPGGVFVRVTALKVAGASIRSGAAATVHIALLSLAMSCLAAAVALESLARTSWSWPLVLVGLLTLPTGLIGCARISGRWSLSVGMAILKACGVALGAARLLLCFGALSQMASFRQCLVIIISAVAGSAVAVVPAGLGINEAVAAGLAPLAGLSAPVAFVATLLNRILGLAVILPLALALAVLSGRTISECGESGG